VSHFGSRILRNSFQGDISRHVKQFNKLLWNLDYLMSLLPLEHSVALKVVKNKVISTMHNEAHVLNWNHKNIVRLIKLESTPEFGLLIMERPNGLCLQRVLDTLPLPLVHRVL